jgi:hypothetical protein
MDSESMGYMNGGGIGSMMQPRMNFAGGGGDFEPLGYQDESITIEDLTETDNNGNFLISAAEALPDQTGTINSAPSITNSGVNTIEGSLIDGDDPSSRYAVQQDFPSTIDRFSNSVAPVPPGVIPDRNRGQIIERNPSAPFNRATINEIAGPSTIDRFSNSVGPVPNEITDRNRGQIGSNNLAQDLEGVARNTTQAEFNSLVDDDFEEMKGINFRDDPVSLFNRENNIATGIIDKNITNRAFNKGTPEATAEFLAANNFPIPENLKQFLEIDAATGKYVSKKSPNNFMSFMSNIPTPFNLARKTFSALGNANSAVNKKMRGIDPATGLANTQAQYEADRARSQTVGRVNDMMARKAAGKSYSQKNLDRLSAEISAGRDPNQGNTVTGFGKSGMGRDPNDVTGGSSGSSGGKSIVCTAMYQTTGLQDWAKAMKVWYIYQKRHLSDAHQEGYHLLFKPFVKGMHKSKIIRAIGAHVAKHRTQELKHIMFNSKSDTLGKIYNNILEPICYLAGKIKSIFKK